MKLYKKNVNKLLKEKKITAYQISDDLDIPYAVFNKYLNAGCNISLSRAHDIADYLDVPLLEVVQFNGFDY